MLYSGCDFYAEKTSGHRFAPLAGTVLVVSRTVKNGICPKAVAVPKGQPNAVPVATWVHPDHLAKRCVKVTEADARRIHPAIFAALEAFDRSPEYRAMHAAEIARAVMLGVYPVQPADPRVLDRMGLTHPEETPDGFAPARGRAA
jgi:hypothetical protein